MRFTPRRIKRGTFVNARETVSGLCLREAAVSCENEMGGVLPRSHFNVSTACVASCTSGLG